MSIEPSEASAPPPWTGLPGLIALRSRVEAWVGSTPWISGAAMFGSTERVDRPADEWSDLDVLMVVDDPRGVTEDPHWPGVVGAVWISLVHDAPVPGIRVRQVLYEPGHDVDWVPVSWSDLDRLPAEAGKTIAGHGFRVIKDSGGRLAAWTARQVVDPGPTDESPSRDEFTWTVEDALYQLVWATKRLRRGEIWRARADVDGYIKEHVLTLLRWHAIVLRPTAVTFSEGRRLEVWADPRILDDLPGTFGRYGVESLGRATLRTLDLIGLLGTEIAMARAWPYPADRHATIRRWIAARLQEGGMMGTDVT